MIQFSKSDWEIAGGAAFLVVLGAGIAWQVFRKSPTQDEMEYRRRRLLVESGRLVDGMLLDICEMSGPDGRAMTLLFFSYRIGGVDYECSQDITAMHDTINPADVRVGFPCTVRYQPGNPQNSIVVAETWRGMRAGLSFVQGKNGSKAMGTHQKSTSGTADS